MVGRPKYLVAAVGRGGIIVSIVVGGLTLGVLSVAAVIRRLSVHVSARKSIRIDRLQYPLDLQYHKPDWLTPH